jgi:hypothetical protein
MGMVGEPIASLIVRCDVTVRSLKGHVGRTIVEALTGQGTSFD